MRYAHSSRMENLNKPSKGSLSYLCAIVLTVSISCICLFAVRIWPFGDSCFTFVDNAQGVAPLLASAKLVLSGVEDWNWTFLSGGVNRTAMLASYHLFFAPTAWFACLLPADSWLQTHSWLFLIQTACSTAAALFYLRHTFPRCPDALKLALAVSYTFSDFLFTKFTFLPFLNISAFFPLFLYSLDLLLKRGKYWPYLLISAYMMAVAPYFFWMWGVFSVIYIGAQLKLGWVLYKGRQPQLHLLLFVGMTLLALGLSAFSWLPSCMLTSESARAGMLPKSALFRTFHSPFLLLCWMLTPLLFSLLAISRNCRFLLFKSHYGLALILLLICCGCTTMNYFMHLGIPTGFPTRFSYMITMMACCLVAQGVPDKLQISTKTILLIAGLACMTACVSNADSYAKYCWLVAFILLVPILYKQYYKTALLVLCTISCLMFVDGYYAGERQWLEDMPERITRAEKLHGILEPWRTEPWSRTKSVDLSLSSNFSEVSGINSFCNFFHSSSSRQQDAVSKLGYLKHFTRILDMGGTIFSDTFMGCEFLVSHQPMDKSLITPVTEKEGLYVYRNPYYWGDGVLLSPDAYNKGEEWGDDTIGNQQKLFKELGGEGSLFEARRASIEWDEQRRGFAVYRTLGREWLYWAPDTIPFMAHLFSKSWYTDHCAPASPSAIKGNRCIVSLPTSDSTADRRVPLLQIGEHEPGPDEALHDKQVALYRLCIEKLAPLAAKLRGKVRVSDIRGRTMDVDVNSADAGSVLLLPYVYHKGYSAKDETGKELQVCAHHGFTAIHLDRSGKQKVSLHYSLPYEKPSLLFSAGCLLLLPLPALMRRLRSLEFINEWKSSAEKLIALGAVIGSLFVLSSPIWSKLVELALLFR